MLVVAIVSFAIVSTNPRPSGDDQLLTGDGARAALSDLATAMDRTAGLHVTGIALPTQGKSVPVDVWVTHPGDAVGTFPIADGKFIDYVAGGGTSFVKGGRSAWKALGVTDEPASGTDRQWSGKGMYADQSITPPPELLPDGDDLAATYSPQALARSLRPTSDNDRTISVGKPIDLNGHRSQPVHIGHLTVYLGSSVTPTDGQVVTHGLQVDRIDMADPDATDPTAPAIYELTAAAMTIDQVRNFYDYIPQQAFWAVIDPSDPRIRLTTKDLTPNPCGETSCVLQWQLTNAIDNDRRGEIKQVSVGYNVSAQANGASSNCGSVTSPISITMARDSSVMISCPITYPGSTSGGKITVDVYVRAAIFTIADKEKFDKSFAANRDGVVALAAATPSSTAQPPSSTSRISTSTAAPRGPPIPRPDVLDEATWQILSKSPTLMRDWRTLFSDKGWKLVANDAGAGSRTVKGVEKTIWLDPDLKGHTLGQAQTIVHEIGHAMYEEGVLEYSSREAYVASVLKDEGAATLYNIVVAQEIRSVMGPDIGIVGQPAFEGQFQSYAFYSRTASEPDRDRYINELSRSYVNLIVSGTTKTYPQYYGDLYDKWRASW
ncbi:hypothetical protein GCM10027167_50380 [Nocardia heshunensis]